jgi:ferric-dicitrate binding protein FerR (iron transport regulator)
MRDDGDPLSERHVTGVLRSISEEHARGLQGREADRAWDRVEVGTAHTQPPAARSGGSRTMVASVCLAAVAAIWLTLGFQDDSQLSFELRGATSQAGIIEARRGEATVSLSDGSSILAENRTRFSVDVVGQNAALTRLVSGKLHVRVADHEDTSYRFIAGPYEVRVLGNEFDLSWEPSGAGLTLSMSKGEVRVAGLDGTLHSVAAGQVLHLPAERMPGPDLPETAEPASLPAGVETVNVQAASTSPDGRLEEPAAISPTGEVAAVGRLGSWDALVARGQFADVVREAETLGVDAVLQSRTPGDLKALGQAARYLGDRSLSLRAFHARPWSQPGQ